MIRSLAFAVLFLVAVTARGQIQVDSEIQAAAIHRLRTSASRRSRLPTSPGATWSCTTERPALVGFEVTASEGRTLAPLPQPSEPPLKIAAGASVTRKINLTPLFPITDLGVYHVRANVFFADLNKFFYARAKVFEVTTGASDLATDRRRPSEPAGRAPIRS